MQRFASWAFIFAVGLAGLPGCKQRTEVVLGLATDLKATGQIDTVQLTVQRDGVQLINVPLTLSGVPDQPSELPGSYGLLSPDGTALQVQVEVVGYLGRTAVVDRQTTFTLVPDLTLFQRLTLTSLCNPASGGPTCAADESCAEGQCVKQEVDARRFPAFKSDLVTHVACPGAVQYIDTSTDAAMPSLPGSGDCTGTDFCQEATCYHQLTGDDLGTGGTTAGGTTGGGMSDM